MGTYFWWSLLLLVTSFVALLFGIIKVFPRTKGLYFRMGTMGMACLFVGYLSSLVLFLTGGEIYSTTNVSVLGNIGFTLFLMTQNADSVSSVMYKPGKGQGKNSVLSLIVPALIVAFYIYTEIKIYNSTEEHGLGYWVGNVILIGVGTVLSAVASFYAFRFFLAPDEELGMVHFLRPYNITLTILLLLLIPERFVRTMTLSTPGETVLIVVYYLLLASGILAVIPLMERGRVKFLTSL